MTGFFPPAADSTVEAFRPTRRRVLAGAGALCLSGWLSQRSRAETPLPGVPTGSTAAALAVTELGDASLKQRSVRREAVCSLACPTGRIVACDPLVSLGYWRGFARAVPEGHHPVAVYVDEANDWGERVALAELRISEAPVVRWEMALIDEAMRPEMIGDTISGYGVDAGMGCFCDAATQVSFRINETARQWLGLPSYSEGELLEAALAVETGAEHRLSFDPSRNVALFSSGFGDGYYASYWGMDAEGGAARLVTSFGVFEAAADEAETATTGKPAATGKETTP